MAKKKSDDAKQTTDQQATAEAGAEAGAGAEANAEGDGPTKAEKRAQEREAKKRQEAADQVDVGHTLRITRLVMTAYGTLQPGSTWEVYRAALAVDTLNNRVDIKRARDLLKEGQAELESDDNSEDSNA